MNMTAHAQFTVAPTETIDIPEVTAIYAALRGLTDQNMPDNLMDAIGDALEVARHTIVDAPVLSSRDIGAKLRFCAILVEDDEAGCLAAENVALQQCVDDLANYRDKQWRAALNSVGIST